MSLDMPPKMGMLRPGLGISPWIAPNMSVSRPLVVLFLENMPKHEPL